ncbi:MAG: hypothetical protein U0871_25990 [Gemmataceae bacterium]
MTRTRWKLAAGALTLSLGGLAAVADGPVNLGTAGCRAAPPVVPVAFQQPAPLPMPAVKVGLEPPVAVAPPAPADVPQAVPPVVPTPLTLPPASPAPAVPAPAVPATVIELPLISAPPGARPMPVVQASGPELAPMPRPAGGWPRTELTYRQPLGIGATQATPTPVVQGFVLETGAVAAAPAPTANPMPVANPTPTPAVARAPEPQAIPIQPQPTPAPTATPAAEKKLRVVLHMSDDRPRFIVQDGDETYLRVVCDGVEVKSPSDRGEMMSVLKATGKVAFVTPGGDGTCDELTVVPGTGQVTVSGKVSFKYNWGKLETTVTGERMTFRLGAAAAPVMSTSYRK